MEFTWLFVHKFFKGLLMVYPLFLFFIFIIVILALIIKRTEKWSFGDSLYFAFITATTVGYGDMKPGRKSSRLVSVLLAFVGLLFTGLVLALAVATAQQSFIEIYGSSYLASLNSG